MRTLIARRRALIPALLLAFVAAAALCLTALTWAPHEAKAQTVPPPLHWRPPTQSSPSTIQVWSDGSCSPSSACTRSSLGNNMINIKMDTSKDYNIKLPKATFRGGFQIYGGRNVIIKGGKISPNPEGRTNNDGLKGIYASGNAGTLHIEGVEIDAEGRQTDAFQFNTMHTVQLEDNRVDRITGREDQTHADVVQLTNPIGALRVDRLTGTSNYQGLQYAKYGYSTTMRTNMRSEGWINQPYAGKYLVFVNKDGCDSEGGEFHDTYIEEHPGRSLGLSVHPTTNSSLTACRAVLSPDGQSVSWPTLPIKGSIQQGPPPGGDFVPAGTVGYNYVNTLGYE